MLRSLKLLALPLSFGVCWQLDALAAIAPATTATHAAATPQVRAQAQLLPSSQVRGDVGGGYVIHIKVKVNTLPATAFTTSTKISTTEATIMVPKQEKITGKVAEKTVEKVEEKIATKAVGKPTIKMAKTDVVIKPMVAEPAVGRGKVIAEKTAVVKGVTAQVIAGKTVAKLPITPRVPDNFINALNKDEVKAILVELKREADIRQLSLEVQKARIEQRNAMVQIAESQKISTAQKLVAEKQRLAEQKKAEEQKRIEEKRRIEEQKKLEAEKMIAEQKKAEEQKKIEEQRKIEEQKKIAEQKRIAEQKKLEEQKILDEQKRAIEQQKIIAAQKLAAEQQRAVEQKKIEEQKRLAEQKRLEEQKRIAEQQKLVEQKKAEEQKKIEEQRKIEEQKKIAEQKRIAEQKKLEEQKILDEQKRAIEQQKIIAAQKLAAEQQRAVEQKKIEEQKRLAEQKHLEEQKRIAEQQKLVEQKKAEEQRKVEEQKRIAEQQRIEEQQRLAAQKKIEEQKKLQTQMEEQRKVEEQKRVALLEQQKIAEQKKLSVAQKKMPASNLNNLSNSIAATKNDLWSTDVIDKPLMKSELKELQKPAATLKQEAADKFFAKQQQNSSLASTPVVVNANPASASASASAPAPVSAPASTSAPTSITTVPAADASQLSRQSSAQFVVQPFDKFDKNANRDATQSVGGGSVNSVNDGNGGSSEINAAGASPANFANVANVVSAPAGVTTGVVSGEEVKRKAEMKKLWLKLQETEVTRQVQSMQGVRGGATNAREKDMQATAESSSFTSEQGVPASATMPVAATAAGGRAVNTGVASNSAFGTSPDAGVGFANTGNAPASSPSVSNPSTLEPIVIVNN